MNVSVNAYNIMKYFIILHLAKILNDLNKKYSNYVEYATRSKERVNASEVSLIYRTFILSHFLSV